MFVNKSLINRQAVINLINRILPYSAINKKANSPPPYSILKPDTNSDSPSARSKGARLVSAKHLVNHIRNKGEIIIINHVYWAFLISGRLNENVSIIIFNKIKAIVTS